jgi:HAD superfamily hydrolase (TIGR01549 family)
MKLIIYDFDGVLVDSVRSIILYYNEIFKHVGIAPPNWEDPSVLSKVRGMSFDQFMDVFVSETHKKEFSSYTPNFTFAQMAEATPLQPEIKDVIEELSANHTFAICTNRNTQVDDLLDYHGLRKYFSYIVTNAEAKPKPSPDGLNKILSALGEKTALYVGDSEVDYLAAQNAGIPFLGYKTDIKGIDFILKHSDIYRFLPDGYS